MTQSLTGLLAELHAERVATWAPEALKVNVDQRRTLVETADPSAWIKVGGRVPTFNLPEVDGGEVSRQTLTDRGPAVLIFFRFANCPACNIALPFYERNLWPKLKTSGASLTAVSPQVPDRLVAIKRRHGLTFNVASDPGNALGRRFGVLYEFDDASKASANARGAFIGDVTGTGTWELPMPTVVVFDRTGKVSFADVSPDWLVRTEAEPILGAVAALLAPA
jgi:peroxiredoxin